MTAGTQDDLWYTDLSPADLWHEVLRPVHDTPAALRAVHNDWRPSRVSARESLRLAITECARLHEDQVHISLFRDLLPSTVPPPAIGAAISAWTKAGYLELTNTLAPMGGTAGNANKWSPIRKLVRAIPPDTRKS